MQYEGFWKFLMDSFDNLTQFAGWLNQDLFKWGDVTITPLVVFGFAGFTTIIAVHIFHLLNPFG